MQQTIEIDRLSLDRFRAIGPIPKDTPELRRRIQDHGCIEPVVVRQSSHQPGRFEILANPETYVAAGKLGLDRVPVVVRDDVDDEEATEIVSAQQRGAAGNPIDEAEWYQERLNQQTEVHGGNPKIARLARLVGKSRSHVSRALALLTLPPSVQEHFRRGELSAAHGRFLVKLNNSVQQKQLASRAAKEGLSVRDLQGIVNGAGQASEPPSAATPSPDKDPDTLRLERQLTAHMGSPVSIDHQAGTISVQYFGNYETLEGILEKMGYRADR